MAAVGGRVDSNGRNCKPCLNKDIKRDADVFCPTCNAFQCNDCSNVHTIYDFMKDHTLLTVTDGLSYVANKLDLKGLDICTKHKKPFEFYCEDDKVLLCSTCAIVGHKRCHNVTEIENVVDEGQYDILREKLQTAITTTNQTVENLTKAESILTADIGNIPKKLSEMRTNIIQTFDEFAKKLTQDANSYRDKTITDWTKSKVECEDEINFMKQSFETIDSIATHGTPSQQFIATHSMAVSIQKQVKNAGLLCADLHTLHVACDFIPKFDTLKSDLLSAVKPGEFEIKYNIPKTTKLVQIAAIDLKQTGDDVGEPFYTGLDFLPDGRLVAVDNKNGKCLLYDENLRMKTVYKLPYNHPQCVVVVSDDEVAITTSNEYRLDFLHVSKSNVITLNRTCKVSVQYGSISMKDDKNFVVSTIDHNTPVRIVSMSGEEKDFGIAFPSKKYPISTSSCTYIRDQDKIVLTDIAADVVFIYNATSGDHITIKDTLITAPQDVAVGPYDHVFFGNRSTTTSIVEITPAGRVLSSHQVDMKKPRTLAVSKDRRRLAVSNSLIGHHQLNLYQIQSVY